MVTATFTPLFGIPMGPEVLVILLIAILLFGANKIPKLARSSGEAIGEFQKGREEVEQELEEIRQGPSTEDDEGEPAAAPDSMTEPTDTATEPATETNTDATTEDR